MSVLVGLVCPSFILEGPLRKQMCTMPSAASSFAQQHRNYTHDLRERRGAQRYSLHTLGGPGERVSVPRIRPTSHLCKTPHCTGSRAGLSEMSLGARNTARHSAHTREGQAKDSRPTQVNCPTSPANSTSRASPRTAALGPPSSAAHPAASVLTRRLGAHPPPRCSPAAAEAPPIAPSRWPEVPSGRALQPTRRVDLLALLAQ
jgi:hypothetical protein